MLTAWVARNCDGALKRYRFKPFMIGDKKSKMAFWSQIDSGVVTLPRHLYPEVGRGECLKITLECRNCRYFVCGLRVYTNKSGATFPEAICIRFPQASPSEIGYHKAPRSSCGEFLEKENGE